MANELQIVAQGDTLTVYAVIRRASDNGVYSVGSAAFVAWSNLGIADYAVPLTNRGGDLYTGDFPTAVIVSTQAIIFYYIRAGAMPAITDTLIAKRDVLWNGTAIVSSGGSVGAIGCPLVGLDTCKRYMQISLTNTSRDDLIQQCINQASEMFEREADRHFCAADYVEFINAEYLQAVPVKNYPIISVNRVATGRVPAIYCNYSGSDVRALVSVTDDRVNMTSYSTIGVKTSNDFTFDLYPTLNQLAVGMTAVPGWTVTGNLTASVNGLTRNLYRFSGLNARQRSAQLIWPFYDLDYYEVKYNPGTVRVGLRREFGAYSGWGGDSPRAQDGAVVMVEYRGGYETIPQDIQGVVMEMVWEAMLLAIDPSKASITFKSNESLGDYSVGYSNIMTKLIEMRGAAMQRILGKNASVVDLYRNVQIAAVA